MCHMAAEGNKRSSRLTSDEWPWTGYPPHLDGASLVLSGRTILPLLAAFQTTPFNPIDDLYLSGICTEKAGIQLLYSVGSFTRYYVIFKLYNLKLAAHFNSLNQHQSLQFRNVWGPPAVRSASIHFVACRVLHAHEHLAFGHRQLLPQQDPMHCCSIRWNNQHDSRPQRASPIRLWIYF